MIDPQTQPDGEAYLAYNRRRWGSDGWTRPMRAAGKREGAAYANWVWWPNSTHAGRMLLHAERHGLGDKLMGVLYHMCYERGENVSLRETVGRAAAEAGVPNAEEYAASDEGMHELGAALRDARAGGKRVSAAPTFRLSVGGMSETFSGARDSADWLDMLEQCAEIAEGS